MHTAHSTVHLLPTSTHTYTYTPHNVHPQHTLTPTDSQSLWRNPEVQNPAPHTRRRGRGAERAEGGGRAGPSSPRQACWDPKASPRERPPRIERSACSTHCVHCLIFIPGGRGFCYVHFTDKKVEVLRCSGYPAGQRQSQDSSRQSPRRHPSESLPGEQDSSLLPGPGSAPAPVPRARDLVSQGKIWVGQDEFGEMGKNQIIRIL